MQRNLGDTPRHPFNSGEIHEQHPGEWLSESAKHRSGIPDVVVRRLPVYMRSLRTFEASGAQAVSSNELADAAGVTAAQVRRDLSYFGRFGKQGSGYPVQGLAREIEHILRLDREWPVALAGYGNLGRAIANFRWFLPTFRIAVIFDALTNPGVDEATGLPLFALDRIAAEISHRQIRMGIIATSATIAQRVASDMIEGGVDVLLNYAPLVLRTPAHVTVREIDPLGALQSLAYYLQDDDPHQPEHAEHSQQLENDVHRDRGHGDVVDK